MNDISQTDSKSNPARFERDLAVNLTNLSNGLHDVGDNSGAVNAALEAVTIFRRLVHFNPTRFEPELALTLSNQALRLSDNGDGEGALLAIRQSVALSQKLRDASPVHNQRELDRRLQTQALIEQRHNSSPSG